MNWNLIKTHYIAQWEQGTEGRVLPVINNTSLSVLATIRLKKLHYFGYLKTLWLKENYL
jgi:hypothetical protein